MEQGDSKLLLHEKLELIEWIPIRQKERWARMMWFRNYPHLNIKDRHYFMAQEIKLMRSQKDRLLKLIMEVALIKN